MTLICSGAVDGIKMMMEKHNKNKEILMSGLRVLKVVVQPVFLTDETTSDSMSIDEFDKVINSTISLVVKTMKDVTCDEDGNVCMHCCEIISVTEQGKSFFSSDFFK